MYTQSDRLSRYIGLSVALFFSKLEFKLIVWARKLDFISEVLVQMEKDYS